MPTYQYRCTACSNELEVVQKFTDPSLTTCPECSGDLRKVFNAVGVVFKGSGFYRTDSRSDAKSGGAKSDSSPSTKEKSDSSSGSKSDSSTKSESGSAKSDSGTKKSDSGTKKSDSGSSTSKVSAGAA